MNVYEAIVQRRTIRRFRPQPVSRELLTKLVDGARMAPSGGNIQPWVFVVVDDPALVVGVFPLLAWAGYIAPRGIPGPGERPTAYIVVLQDPSVKSFTPVADVAAAIENITLLAVSEGIGTCWIGSVKREALGHLLSIPSSHVIDSVVALGYPAEAPVIEPFSDSVKYWKDERNVLHVPKKSLDQIVRFNGFSGPPEKT